MDKKETQGTDEKFMRENRCTGPSIDQIRYFAYKIQNKQFTPGMGVFFEMNQLRFSIDGEKFYNKISNAENYTVRMWIPRSKERYRENLPYGGVVFDVNTSYVWLKCDRYLVDPFSFQIGKHCILFFIYYRDRGYFVEAEQSIDYY